MASPPDSPTSSRSYTPPSTPLHTPPVTPPNTPIGTPPDVPSLSSYLVKQPYELQPLDVYGDDVFITEEDEQGMYSLVDVPPLPFEGSKAYYPTQVNRFRNVLVDYQVRINAVVDSLKGTEAIPTIVATPDKSLRSILKRDSSVQPITTKRVRFQGTIADLEPLETRIQNSSEVIPALEKRAAEMRQLLEQLEHKLNPIKGELDRKIQRAKNEGREDQLQTAAILVRKVRNIQFDEINTWYTAIGMLFDEVGECQFDEMARLEGYGKWSHSLNVALSAISDIDRMINNLGAKVQSL